MGNRQLAGSTGGGIREFDAGTRVVVPKMPWDRCASRLRIETIYEGCGTTAGGAWISYKTVGGYFFDHVGLITKSWSSTALIGDVVSVQGSRRLMRLLGALADESTSELRVLLMQVKQQIVLSRQRGDGYFGFRFE